MNIRDDPRYKELATYVMAAGKAICGIRERRLYNPLRYIKGKYYFGSKKGSLYE